MVITYLITKRVVAVAKVTNIKRPKEADNIGAKGMPMHVLYHKDYNQHIDESTNTADDAKAHNLLVKKEVDRSVVWKFHIVMVAKFILLG